ncbi:PREDICTED: uncharacterized protein LOC109466643 [Branchiostoma belcheri]|uniref:Uncharacterized protein LOC109466643 n=1 Tax=Branchiostoma belcheri TaxID=7741 RepID=A0A6P4YCN4_BRABE|nr:PREDICTED: uncharacterized protein LOC109466643 [Branchiostoma belcheri]
MKETDSSPQSAVSLRIRIMKTIAVLIMTCVFVVRVSGHSWVSCTDYTEKNGATWDQAKCRGFPRSAERFANRQGVFGVDTGYDFTPSENQACKTARNDVTQYSASHPMAVYYPGQEVVFVHPTKNHVADIRCTNKFIPDRANKILMGARNAPRDVRLSQFREVADLGVSPAPIFKGCYIQLLTNDDLALAGRYTFVWLWEFNGGQFYSSCWEADVVATRAERDNRLTQQGSSGGDASSRPGSASSGSSSPSTSDGSSETTGMNMGEERRSLTVQYTQEWPGGAQGRIRLPNSRRTLSNWRVEVQFPCPDITFNVWNAESDSSGGMMSHGLYVLRQTEGWMLNKNHVGFTVQRAPSCDFAANDIDATLVSM